MRYGLTTGADSPTVRIAFASAIDAAAYADRINVKMGVTPAQREAFTMRSMVPGSPATEADFINAKPLLAEFHRSAAGPVIPDCAPSAS